MSDERDEKSLRVFRYRTAFWSYCRADTLSLICEEPVLHHHVPRTKFIVYLDNSVMQVHIDRIHWADRGKAGAASRSDAAPLPAPETPRLGEKIAGLLAGRAHREAILGDLAEGFEARAARCGPRRARLWYWWQVARSAGALAWSGLQRAVQLNGLLRLIGL